MEERIIQFRVGIVVIASVIIGVILVLYFGEGFKPKYSLFLKTDMAPGVSKGTPVMKNGIRIGRVSGVETQEDGVLLTLQIDEGEQVYSGEVCEFVSSPLAGDTTLNFVQGIERGDQLLNGDSVLQIKVGPRSQEVLEMVVDLKDSVEQAFTSIRDAGDAIRVTSEEVASISRRVNTALGDEDSEFRLFFRDLRSATARAEMAIENLNKVIGHVEEIVGDEGIKTKIRSSLDEFPMLVAEARETLQQAQGLVDRYSSAGERLDRNLANIEPLTEALGANGDEFALELRDTLHRVNGLAAELETFTSALNNSEGSLGLMIHDPELYEHLNSSMANIEDITLRLRPLVNDLRGFADRVNRDPGVIVRGALDGGPDGSGPKLNFSTSY
ncbi:MAG: MCE family protein [Planctomycetales bacterium]|nr:MCE family protein [Planctomycetales bacterium]